MENLKWKQFLKPRRFYIEPLVREFYNGIQDAQEGNVVTHSIVRYMEVFFDSDRINRFYELVCESDVYEKQVIVMGK
jgi:hypothetical protein